MSRSRAFPLLSATALALCAGAAAAQDWYTVEVIVFEHRADASGNGERFPRDPGVPDIDAAVDLQPSTRPPTLRPFEQLAPEALQMGGAFRTLERSSRYQPLVHTGWMQPGLSRDDARPLRITLQSGERLPAEPLVIELPDEPGGDEADQEPVEGSFDEVVDEPVDEPFGKSPDGQADEPGSLVANPWWHAERLRTGFDAPPEPERLTGTVTLVLQRFLHVEADLLLTTGEPLPADADADADGGARDWHTRREGILTDLVFERIGVDEARTRLEALNAEPRFQSYRVRESRRVRSGELHYIDHPRLGIVVMVRPVPRDEVEARQQAYDDALRRELERRLPDITPVQ